MTNRSLILFLPVLFQTLAFCQIKLSGTILDKKTQQPIEYANIGLYEKGVGTVCNAQGKFELIVPNDLINNSLVVSHVGYENTTLPITEFNNHFSELRIELNPAIITLPEITIIAAKETNLGHKPTNDKIKGFFKAAGLGMEGGTLIKNSGQAKLTQFNMNILKIPFDSLKFRLNIYNVKNGKPSSKVNSEDIIFTISKSDTGVFSLPLIDEDIQVTDNFICTIELIELFGQSPQNAEFLFSAIPDKDGYIFKKSISLGKWEKIKKYSLCFWLSGKK
jgi:hypothetical protein